MSANKVRIYALGGTGTNIARFFEADLPKGIHSMTYVDTSRSNIKDSAIGDENIYIFKNEAGQELDGAGKKRDTHAPLIQKQTPDILNKHAPGQFNIVVFSLSGGSGSVAGPVLIDSLLSRGEKVVACVVSSFKDARQVENTDMTFKTMGRLSKKHNVPVILSYHSNAETVEDEKGAERLKTQEEVNDDIREVISLLCLLFSGENERLDSADLTNMLNYPVVTNVPPSVAELEVVTGYEWPRGRKPPLVSCTLYPKDAPEIQGLTPLYSCDGYLPEPPALSTPVSFVVHSDRLRGIMNDIDQQQKRYAELKAAREEAPDVGGEGDDDNFLLL